MRTQPASTTLASYERSSKDRLRLSSFTFRRKRALLAVRMTVAPVGCNAVAPGFVTTEKAVGLFSDEVLEGMRERSAAGRLAVPDDVARLAVYLASDESSYISGQVIACNAGSARGTRW